MLSHVCVGVRDVEQAHAFYAPLMAALGMPLKFRDPPTMAGWMPADAPRPLFLICRPFDGQVATPGNGQMIALLAPDRQTVDRCHALALQAGGVCEGPPGLRAHYHPNYYGAYFRDPDGNKLCICCHDPE
ncbi:VOC family protein [Burkholderia sp. 22PA0106]|uniref:VOC family protein n=1 Tax=Burkholderia sp. 22PA0106 TaxID=3237371 RepID=UPI0039C1BBA3